MYYQARLILDDFGSASWPPAVVNVGSGEVLDAENFNEPFVGLQLGQSRLESTVVFDLVHRASRGSFPLEDNVSIRDDTLSSVSDVLCGDAEDDESALALRKTALEIMDTVPAAGA